MFVRSARETDGPAIADLYGDGGRGVPHAVLPPDDDRVAIESFAEDARVRHGLRAPYDWHGWVVAVADDEVLAAGSGGMASESVGEVFALRIRPDAPGAGEALLRTMTAQQVVDGAREQRATCDEDDEDAFSVFRDNGFEVESRRRRDDASGSALRLSRRI